MSGMREKLVCVVVLCALLAATRAAESQPPESPATESAEESEPGDFDEALDEQAIDVSSSIGDAVERRGFSINGDLRVGSQFFGDDIEDVTRRTADVIRARWRILVALRHSIGGPDGTFRSAVCHCAERGVS
jgi:hypothetical protein